MRALPAVLALMLAVAASAQRPVPALTGRVVDLADVLSPSTEAALTSLLAAHEDSTSNQVAVLTVPSLEGDGLEIYATRVFRAWGLGRADRDNGVLLLVAVEDREVRIEVGYGLEGDLTDATAGTIIRHEIVPRFRDGDFDAGVLAGAEAIVASLVVWQPVWLRGSPVASPAPPSRPPWTASKLGLALILVTGPFVLLLWAYPNGVPPDRSASLALVSAFCGLSMGIGIEFVMRNPGSFLLVVLVPIVIVPINLYLERHPTLGPARRARRQAALEAQAQARKRREAAQVALARRSRARSSSGRWESSPDWGGSSDWGRSSSSSGSSSSSSSSFSGGGGSSGGGGASGKW